ncbi:MAG: TonB-dependent receptor [Gammaproteobacteria bacterium]|nr:TonB-dependent receptor [Gammaproteobacteria bacterium]
MAYFNSNSMVIKDQAATQTKLGKSLPIAGLSAAILGLINVGHSSPVFAEVVGLEEIVVTAQRRAESVQDVPVAISALSANAITEAGITSTEDLQFVTPGLNVGRQLSSAVPFIRGIGTQTTSAGQDSGVSTYVDDVYFSSSTGSILTLTNIERIEVLKGPQGTLFGRNATGGLMHVITKDPSHEFSGNAEVSYGNYDTVGATAYVTGGLSSNVAADLSVYISDQREGYGVNTVTGNDVNETDEYIIRNKWRITAGDNTEIKLSLDYAETDTSTGIAQRQAPGTLGADGLAIFGGLTAPASAGGAGMSPEDAVPIAASMATRFTGDFHNINASVDPIAEVEQWGVSVHLTHSFGDIDLTSVTAYRETDAAQFFAQDQTALPNFVDVLLDQFTETFTQEVRLASSSDKFEWIVGVYLLDEEAGYDPTLITGAALAPLTALVDNNVQDTFSWALFAQMDYHFTESTTLTTGIRYTEDQRDLTGNTSGLAGGVVAASLDFSDSATFDEVTWRLALSHNFDDATMGYVSFNRGFKSGLFNLNVLNPVSGPGPAIEPETLDAYEIGLKTEFFDSRVRLNMAAFSYDYQNLQITLSSTGGATIINAAEASMYGGEIELLAAVTNSLTLNVGISLLDTEYDSFPMGPQSTPTGFGGNIVIDGDLTGNDVSRSPKSTFSIGAVHTAETELGLFTSSLNYYYNDGFFWESDNRLEQESYSILNAQVTWNSSDDQYYVRVFGNNLTDEEYATFGISSDLGDFISASPPRTYGVKVGVNF